MKYFNESDSLIECIPNFSEGRDKKIIQSIADSIENTPNTKVLHVDSGYSANRTVITFVSKSDSVIQAGFNAFRKAQELIDMRKHKGTHPRMGSVDVFPLVPLQKISMSEVNVLAKRLGQLVGNELKIPIFFYEHSTSQPERKNLAVIRKGEYESIPHKMKDSNWKPDYGPFEFSEQSGITTLGAREFLIAYNINLETKDKNIASSIAKLIRESGYIQNGIRIPGKIKGLKAIGWHIKEFGFAQVSTNIVNLKTAPIHVVFELVKEEALKLNTKVTGSELIGLIPREVLVDAGRHYSSTTFHEEDIPDYINLAINNLGLNTLSNFESNERIIENLL